MRSVELNELSFPLLEQILQSPGKPIEVCMQGRRLGTLTFDAAADEAPIDLSRSSRLQQILDEARADYKKRGGVSLEEVKSGLGVQAGSAVPD